MPKEKDNEALWKLEIQEGARQKLSKKLNEISPTVNATGLFWSVNAYNQYHEAVNDYVCEVVPKYPHVLNIRSYIEEVSARLLEEYKKNRGYQPNPAEENSAANLKDLHYQIKIQLQNKTDLESRALLKILTRCSPTSITVRHVQNLLEQKAGRDNFSDIEKKGIARLQSQIADLVEKMRHSGHASFPFASGSSGAESSEPPKVDVTAQSLQP